jgi:hypothetical protein
MKKWNGWSAADKLLVIIFATWLVPPLLSRIAGAELAVVLSIGVLTAALIAIFHFVKKIEAAARAAEFLDLQRAGRLKDEPEPTWEPVDEPEAPPASHRIELALRGLYVGLWLIAVAVARLTGPAPQHHGDHTQGEATVATTAQEGAPIPPDRKAQIRQYLQANPDQRDAIVRELQQRGYSTQGV